MGKIHLRSAELHKHGDTRVRVSKFSVVHKPKLEPLFTFYLFTSKSKALLNMKQQTIYVQCKHLRQGFLVFDTTCKQQNIKRPY